MLGYLDKKVSVVGGEGATMTSGWVGARGTSCCGEEAKGWWRPRELVQAGNNNVL